MKLLLFSTHRQIRNYLSQFNNTPLDKYKTIGEFLNDIVVVKNKKFIDNDIRKLYLFEAIKDIDIHKLGFKKEFLSFSKNSDFIFSFLKEIFIEKVSIENIEIADTYVEFEEHLNLIKEIKNNYKNLLDENGYIDLFLIEEYEINKGLLDGIEEIEIFLDGYLSKWDIEILNKIEIPIKIDVYVSKFNKSLISKFLLDLEENYKYKIDLHSKTILEKIAIEKNPQVEVNYFSQKFDEINFVFGKIAEFIEDGLDASKIAVILPDESMSEYLEEFDEFNNLNFAMGKSFRHSNLFIKLNALYEYHLNKDEINKYKAKDFIEEFDNYEVIDFIRKKANHKELKVIDEHLFKLENFKHLFNDKYKYLQFILEKLKDLSFDDVYSGKITTMGVLESRGMEYDGVIILDFNEGVVPNINSKDLFLNSSIRKKASLPTRMDKENLQKHYYFSLLKNSKKVAISYIKNEEMNVSRFLYELGLEIGENKEDKYKEVLYNFSTPKQKAHYDETFQIQTPITPSSLKNLLECPKKYYFSKILKIKNEEEGEDNFGNIFHKVLEDVVKNKNILNSSDDYFNEIMSKLYISLNSKKEIFEIRVKYEDNIKKFCEEDFEAMKYSDNLVEEWLKIDNLSAKVDRVDITQNSVVLIDYKTGNVDNLLSYPYEFQPTFYYLWAKKNYPNKDIKVVYWDIKNGKKIDATILEKELKDILNNLPNKVQEAKDVYVGDSVVKEGYKICEWCDYKISCGKF